MASQSLVVKSYAEVAGAVALLWSWLKNDLLFKNGHFANMAAKSRKVEFPVKPSPPKGKIMFSQSSARSKRIVCAALLAFTGYANIAYAADTVALNGTFSVAPNATSAGMGTVEATLNTGSNELTWKVVYSGLSGPAVAAHFHGPAEPGQNAGVVVGFKGSVESPIVGQATITPEQANDLLSGKWYVNIHTKAYPGGEIRAQVMQAK